MSSEETPNENQPEHDPKKTIKFSLKKKWVIGCGGCLGVVVLIMAGLAILMGMGINSAMQISNNAVGAIFGPSYRPSQYIAMGLPINSKNIKTMAMLINSQKNTLVFAIQTELPAEQMQLLHSGKIPEMEALLKHLTDQAMAERSSHSSSKVRSFRLDKIYNLGIAPNKLYTVCNATVGLKKKDGRILYTPTSAALLPQANNGLVILATLDPNNNASMPDTNFRAQQDEMQKQVLQIIQDSELDDRLSVAGLPAAPPIKPAPSSSAGR